MGCVRSEEDTLRWVNTGTRHTGAVGWGATSVRRVPRGIRRVRFSIVLLFFRAASEIRRAINIRNRIRTWSGNTAGSYCCTDGGSTCTTTSDTLKTIINFEKKL